jgi:hypothetical protein
MGRIIPYIMENNNCSKPPTRIVDGEMNMPIFMGFGFQTLARSNRKKPRT